MEKTMNERVENREKTAEATKSKMREILASASAVVAGMMINAGVGAVRLTDRYDRVSIGTESNVMEKADGLFYRNGNLYLFTYAVSEEEEGSEDDNFARLFGNGTKEVLTEGDRKAIDDFVEDYNNPLYNLLDDTYCPFETLDELLATLPVILTENGF